MIPKQFPVINDWLLEYKERDSWMNKGMYAFVHEGWTIPLAKWIGNRKCLEIMAGAGWLAKALRNEDVNIIATDNHSWGKTRKWTNVTDIIEEDCVDSIINYGAFIDILIISWPYMDNNAFKAIKKLNELNPKALIVYIGEDRYGCTADEEFFEHFNTIRDERFEEAVSGFESWNSIYDYPLLGKYK